MIFVLVTKITHVTCIELAYLLNVIFLHLNGLEQIIFVFMAVFSHHKTTNMSTRYHHIYYFTKFSLGTRTRPIRLRVFAEVLLAYLAY